MHDTPFATTFTGAERRLLVYALDFLQANADEWEDAPDEQINQRIRNIEALTAKVKGEWVNPS